MNYFTIFLTVWQDKKTHIFWSDTVTILGLEKAYFIAIIRLSMTNSTFEQQEQQRTLLLKISYWYVTKKVLLRRIFIGVLIGIAAIFWLYTIWGILDLYAISYSRNKAMLEELVSNRVRTQEWIAAHAPRQIETETVRVFSTDGEYDFLTRIGNSSPYYWAEIDYTITFSGNGTEERKIFILPNQEKWLAYLGYEADSRPANPKLQINNVSWHLIDAHDVPNYESWLMEHMNINITDVEYTTEVVLEKDVVAKTKFKAQNLSAYGYWNIGFYVVAYRGATPAAVNYVSLSQFRTGETRPVEVSWFDSLGQVSKMEIEPEVNLFDEENYL